MPRQAITYTRTRPARRKPLIGLCATFVALFVSAPALSQAPETLNLNGHEYELELSENTGLAKKVRGASLLGGQHFRGRLRGTDNSWVRVSRVDGRWTGLASVAGETYTLSTAEPLAEAVSSSATKAAAKASIQALNAAPISELPQRSCAVKHPGQSGSHAHFDSADGADSATGASHSVFDMPDRRESSFPTFCSSTLNGVCMLAEIEFVFDQEFQSKLTDPQATAASIVNMVEGYYEEAFSIAFDVISMEFLSTQVFSDTTDADLLLGGTDAVHPVEDPQSIRALSSSNALSFEQNRRALLHLVTGRNFDGGTAGIAFTNVLCDNFGYAAGTSQLLGVAAGNPAATTALIAAHEIGHNFGAGHDTLENSCGAGHLMEPALSSSSIGFSSCSVDEIETAISAIPTLGQCFSFPIDVQISADTGNPASGVQGEEFIADYTVSTAVAGEAVPQLQITGAVTSGDGRFSSATINGAACTVSNGGLGYTCTLSNPGASAALQITATGYDAAVSFRASASASGSTDLVDMQTSNNSVTSSLSFSGAASAPSTPSTPSSPQPTPSAPQQPQQPETPAADPHSGDDSGGGGAGLWLAFYALMLLTLRRTGLLAAVCALAACQSPGMSADQTLALGSGTSSDSVKQGSYSVVQQRSCYCMRDYTRPIRIWVKQGEVERAEYADDGSDVSSDVQQSLHSLEYWEEQISLWKNGKPNRLELAYDEESGRLSKLDFDPSAMKADDEFRLSFTEYLETAP